MSNPETPAKPTFITSAHCTARVHCVACLTNSTFREAMRRSFQLPEGVPDGVCLDPAAGITLARAQELRKAKTRGEPPLPPLAEEARNVAQAIGRGVKTFIAGQELQVTRAVYLGRLARCYACPSKQFRASNQRCAECGCFVRVKAALAAEPCKLGYWDNPGQAIIPKVLTANLWADRKAELLAILPPDSPAAVALGQAGQAVGGGCAGCRLRTAQAAAFKIFVETAAALPAETKPKLRELFAGFEHASVGPAVRPLAEVLGEKGPAPVATPIQQ